MDNQEAQEGLRRFKEWLCVYRPDRGTMEKCDACIDGIVEEVNDILDPAYDKRNTPEREATRELIKDYPCTKCSCTTPCNESNWIGCIPLANWQVQHRPQSDIGLREELEKSVRVNQGLSYRDIVAILDRLPQSSPVKEDPLRNEI